MVPIPPGEIPNGFEEYNNYQLPNFKSSDVRDGDRVIAESNRRLKISIDDSNKKSSEQSNRILWLTVAMALVAIMQLLLLIIK